MLLSNKKTKIIYCIFLVLLSLLCVSGSVLDISHAPDAVKLITHLGYPGYFITFIGVARLLGILAILIPGYPKIKEWAFAGLFFDMIGALYSGVASGDGIAELMPAIIGLILVTGSYTFY